MSADKVYSGHIDLSVANNSHTKVCERILEDGPGKGKRVLDVGCSEGYLGEALKAFGFEVWGVEPSATAAATARSRLDKVFTGGLEDFFASHSPAEGRFDYLVFGDVLEHLPDPVAILGRCREYLAPGGAVVASIPNIAHLATRLMLLQGQWNYADFGLMDHTHLRFFTRSSTVDLFTQTSFKIESLDRVEIPVEQCGIDIAPGLLAWGKEAIKDADARTFQFVVFARHCAPCSTADIASFNARLTRPSLPTVLVLVPFFEFGLASIRLLNPLNAWIRSYGGQVRVIKFADFQERNLEGIDVAIVQRIVSPSAIRLIRQMQQRGVKVLFDIDDLLTEMPPFLASAAAMTELKPLLEHTLRIVDGITVATSRLGERLASYNRCYVTPNCPAPLLFAPPVQAKEEDGCVTLLMASSDSVRFDFIAPVLKELLNDKSFNVRLVALGPPGEYLASEGLPVERYPNMDYGAFRAFAASMPDALGIIPLDGSSFSACKSAIKFMDYALAGIPSICSDVPPYSDVVRNGETGLLAKNTEESWLKALKLACDSRELRRTLAGNARCEVNKQWSLSRAADAWQVVITTLSGDGMLPRPNIFFHSENRRPPGLSRRWRRLKALGVAIDMEGGWLPFARKVRALWRMEGWRALKRRIGAFRSLE